MRPGSCAEDASGASGASATAPPSSAMNSRRFIMSDFPTHLIDEHSSTWGLKTKIAYSPEVARSEIIPSYHGPDVWCWHEAADLGCPLNCRYRGKAENICSF